MTVAEQLAAARQKLGLSLDDISARTKVSVERLSAIERLDLEGLPSLVYLKGFVRAYAAEVGLDSDTISDRYLSELPERAGLGPADASPGGFISPTSQESLEAFDSEGDVADEALASERDVAHDVARPTSSQTFMIMPSSELEPHETERPPATGATLFASTPTSFAKPRKRKLVPIMLLVFVSALAGIAGFLLSANMDRIRGFGASGSDRASAAAPSSGSDANAASNSAAPRATTAGEATAAAPAPTPDTPARAAEAPATIAQPSKQQASAASSGTTPPALRPKGVNAAPARAAPSTLAPGQTAGAPSHSTSDSSSNISAENARAGANRPGGVTESGAKTGDVSGAWNVISTVESATVDAYKNLRLGFRLHLEQRGNRVVGTGHKIMESGETLPPDRRTPINVDGTLDGNRLSLEFTEQGALRTTAGRFMLYLTDEGSLRGRFRSDAARSSGVTVAVRETSSRQ